MSRRQTFALLLIVLLILPANLTFAQVEKGSPAVPSTSGEPLSRVTGFTSDAEPALPAEVPADWWSTVQAGIRQSEYDITWQEPTYRPDLPAAYQAPNRAQGIRTYFTPQGIRVIPRAEATPSWQIGLRLSGVDAPRQTIVSANRIEYRYESTQPLVSEWYVNGERGLEHGMTLAPVSPGPCTVKLALSGRLTPRLTPDGTVVEFITGDGTVVLRYGPLIATDANGQAVPMELSLGPSFLQISLFPGLPVSLPVTLHTLLTSPSNLASTPNGLSPTPNWMAEDDQANALFGLSVATAGDVNGDGYADVIVGAHEYDNGQTDEGRAYVFYGSPSGLSTAPDWMAEGNQDQAWFGYATGTAGDVNGDGFTDIIVAANGYDNGEVDEGRVYAFYGSVSGPSPTPDWMAEGDQAGAYFGHSVGTAGDVNGDGYSDVIIGALMYDTGQIDVGRAFAYYGSAAGLSVSAGWTAEGDQDTAWFGYSAGTAGDVNGDGFSDIIVGVPLYHNDQVDEGRVYVYHGSAAGPSMTPDWMVEGDQLSAWMGWSAGTAGDVNGDGYSDVIVGAPLYDTGQFDEGRAYVYCGAAAGLNPAAAWMMESNQVSAEMGWSVATAGDVNGDGYADVLVGAHWYDDGDTDEGGAYVYYGSPLGPSTTPDWMGESNQTDAQFGYSVNTAGDVNGDGYADIIIGAPYYDNGEPNEGAAFVYYGTADGPSPTAVWIAESNQAEAWFGFSVGTAGDVNGDGYADVIVGARTFDDGEVDEGAVFAYYGSATGLSQTPSWMAEADQIGAYMGFSTGTAGDVNGDGYADVVVGAPLYNNDQDDDGAVFVYYGSATGLSLVANWSAESDQTGAWFGYSAGTAGDVNGDGYADVVVGVQGYSNDQLHEGRAYVYYGSPIGPSLTPDWVAEGNQAEALFGGPAATAGDVNGDGFSDVIVGASYYDNGETNEGRAYVYSGSAAGLEPSPDWIVESNQASADFGFSLGTAGDVNGDGYADVVVGAFLYDNGQTDEGRALVYYGSAAGLSPSSNWTAESDQDVAGFGYSVGTAGDVNGDGYADVIVGARKYDNGETDEGRAYVYFGSAAGPSTSPNWTAESDQSGSQFGNAVATAGDTNGDGYADIIVAAYHYSNPETSEGRAFLYYGNQGAGLPLVPRQRRADNSAPIAPLGMTDSNAFRLALLGRTPFGRAKVKLEWEVKSLGTLFDGTGTQQSGDWLDTGTAGVQLNELVNFLRWGTTHHWRLRLLYHPATTPFQSYSRWLTMPWNSWNEADLRTPEQAIAGLVAVNDSPTSLGSATRLTATVAAGSNVVYAWAFGDEATGNGAVLAHTYLAPGTYIALVTASNAVSALTTTTTVVVAEAIAGLAAVNDSPTPLGSVTHLTATVTAGSNVLYSWTLGDGTTGTGPVLAHTYLAAGSYPALVTATNAVSTITATTTVLIQSGLQHYYVYLPVVLRAYFSNPCEPNDNPAQACGPLVPSQTYPNYPDDQEDWFLVEVGTAGNLQAEVTNYSATGNLLLYAEGDYVNPIAQWGQGGSTMVAGPVAVAAGRYYVRVYTASGFNTDQLYYLTVTFP